MEHYEGPYLYLPVRTKAGPTPKWTDAHIVHAVATLTERDGRPPTLRELGAALGLRYTRAQYFVNRAILRGRLIRPGTGHRTLQLTPPKPSLQAKSRWVGKKGTAR